MVTATYTAYTAEQSELGSALALPGFFPFTINGTTPVRLEDDDPNLDLSGDLAQMINLAPSEPSNPSNDISSIQVIDVTTSEGVLTFAAVFPDETAIAYLIPLNEAGTALLGIQPGDPDLIGTSNTAELTSPQPEDVPYCFARGTLIRTPDGDRPVEDLVIGDPVMTVEGHSVPVRWLGRQSRTAQFGFPDRLTPIAISAGALGAGLPERDLVLSADHALLLGGMMVNAGALVGEPGIREARLSEFGGRIDYFHIETEGHEIILAEGAPAETFIDYLSRQGFDNYDEFEALYGKDTPAIRERPLPRVEARRFLPRGFLARLRNDDESARAQAG